MKKYFCIAVLLGFCTMSNAQFINKLKDKIKNKTTQKADTKVDEKITSLGGSILDTSV